MKVVVPRKSEFFLTALASLGIAVMAATVTGQAVEFTGEVTRVIDGDTVTVLDDQKLLRKVRLVAIDAPEKGQDFSSESKKRLSTLIYGKRVTVTSKKTDRYGRIIGKILMDGVDVSLEQIRLGLAWHFKEYANEQSASDRKAYAESELAARKEKLKIWSYTNPTPPWSFRSRGRRPNAGMSRNRLRTESNYARQDVVLARSSLRAVDFVKGQLLRGPRGGCFYIKDSKRVYVARELCWDLIKE